MRDLDRRVAGLSTEQFPSVFQRKSWKRRFFVLDEFSISYYKCEQVSSSPRTPSRALPRCCAGTGGSGGATSQPRGQPSPALPPLPSAGQGASAFHSPERCLQDPRVPGQVWVMLPLVFPCPGWFRPGLSQQLGLLQLLVGSGSRGVCLKLAQAAAVSQEQVIAASTDKIKVT